MLPNNLPVVSVMALAATTTLTAAARKVPDNVEQLYKSIRGRGECENVLADGFHSSDGDSGDFAYCGDHLETNGIIYLQGKNGQLVNMDIDCDGIQGGPADDGRCGSSSDTQSQTAFRDDVAGYGQGPPEGGGDLDLDANVHPYVVFGNDASSSNSEWATFDPREHGIEPLSVMAVVCNGKLVYGIWGDTNGDDGDEPMVGEASLSLATACFGHGVNGNSGHDDNDVLYIAFTGDSAVPGAHGAEWNASSPDDFAESIEKIGDKLVQQRIGSNASRKGSGTAPDGGPTTLFLVYGYLFVALLLMM